MQDYKKSTQTLLSRFRNPHSSCTFCQSYRLVATWQQVATNLSIPSSCNKSVLKPGKTLRITGSYYLILIIVWARGFLIASQRYSGQIWRNFTSRLIIVDVDCLRSPTLIRAVAEVANNSDAGNAGQRHEDHKNNAEIGISWVFRRDFFTLKWKRYKISSSEVDTVNITRAGSKTWLINLVAVDKLTSWL